MTAVVTGDVALGGIPVNQQQVVVPAPEVVVARLLTASAGIADTTVSVEASSNVVIEKRMLSSMFYILDCGTLCV